MAGRRPPWQLAGMKWLLALLLVGAAGVALLFVPPRQAALATAHGLRAGLDWLSSLGPHRGATAATHAPPKHPSRKAQVAMAKRASREGIVAQHPKETLQPSDRDALDSLVRSSREK